MKIGISSWTYSWALGIAGFDTLPAPMVLFGLLERAVSLGAEVLQVADNMPLSRCSEEELDKFARFARENHIEIEVGARGLSYDNLITYRNIAKKVGAKLVRTLPHDGTDRPTLEEAVQRVEKVLPEFRQAGIILGIENHDLYKSSWLKALMEHFESEFLGICLDAVNNFGQGESYNEVIGNLGKYTVNFHCKDYVIQRKPSTLGFDLIGAPAGSGFLDLQDAKSKLKDDISWIIELWTPYQGDIASTVSLENDWAEKSVAALKRLRDG